MTRALQDKDPAIIVRGAPIISSADILATDITFLPISVSVQNNSRTDITTDVYVLTIISFQQELCVFAWLFITLHLLYSEPAVSHCY